jgi:hypothetical protein
MNALPSASICPQPVNGTSATGNCSLNLNHAVHQNSIDSRLSGMGLMKIQPKRPNFQQITSGHSEGMFVVGRGLYI